MTGRHRAPAVAASAPAGAAALLGGPAVAARVLVRSPMVVQLQAAAQPGLLVLAAPGGIALPNALVLTSGRRSDGAPGGALAGIEPGASARFGRGEVAVARRGRDDLTVRVTRWRDHCVHLPALDPATLVGRLAGSGRSPVRDAALAERFADLVAAAPHGVGDPTQLLGLGSGSTPEGDDLLAGLLASLLVLGGAAGARDVVRWARTLAATIDRAAPTATTALSAALLRHAGRGEVVPHAAAALRALAGRGELAPAQVRLASLGVTSGRSLVTGLRAGATLVAAEATARTTGRAA